MNKPTGFLVKIKVYSNNFYDFVYLNDMKNKITLAAFLILVAIISCNDPTNNVTNSKPDTTKAHAKNSVEDTSINGILVNTVTLLVNHNADINNDRCFAEMILYSNHAGVDMSRILIKEGKNEELKKFANENAEKRRDQMNEMSLFLNNEPDDKSPASKDFKNAVNNAISKMNSASNVVENNIDILFIKSMIPLQQCAIDIAEAENRYGSHQTLKIHARNIVSAGQEEINWMQEWLKKNQLR
jgi:uncharacterized protein (DUF305 family)